MTVLKFSDTSFKNILHKAGNLWRSSSRNIGRQFVFLPGSPHIGLQEGVQAIVALNVDTIAEVTLLSTSSPVNRSLSFEKGNNLLRTTKPENRKGCVIIFISYFFFWHGLIN
jgi:uncharacterized protein YaaW (UPF0174 family)